MDVQSTAAALRTQLTIAVGGIAVVLTIAALTGAWQVAGQRDATISPPAATAIAPDGAGPVLTARTVEDPIVYIVRSQDDAELIQRFATELSSG